MAARNVTVTLRATTGAYTRAMVQAATQAKALATELKKLDKVQGRLGAGNASDVAKASAARVAALQAEVAASKKAAAEMVATNRAVAKSAVTAARESAAEQAKVSAAAAARAGEAAKASAAAAAHAPAAKSAESAPQKPQAKPRWTDTRVQYGALAGYKALAVQTATQAKEHLSSVAQFAAQKATQVRGHMSAAMAAADQLQERLRDNVYTLHRTGSELLRIGAVGAAALGAVAYASVKWESDFAGVRKTVDGTEQQLSALSRELLHMSTVIPESTTKIAQVAEQAGQLGIATPHVAQFTRTMLMMGTTTNLSADQAAEAIARFMNVMQSAPDAVTRIGSTIVDLGNKGATTEKEITQMAQRIASAGATVGLAEPQVLGLAAAMSNVGIKAEAGGSAMSQILIKIDKMVRGGGQQLEQLASIAGVSASAFAEAWRTNAAGALTMLTAGLGRAHAAGQDMNSMLADLGIRGLRESDTMRRLALSGSLLADTLKTAGDAWSSNSALAVEAAKRYQTTEAQITMAINSIKVAAINLGDALAPSLRSAAQSIAGMGQSLASMSPAGRAATLAIVGVVAGVGLFGGAALKAVASAVDLAQSLKSLGVSGAAAKAGMLKAGIAAAVLIAAMVTLAAAQAKWGDEARRSLTTADTLTAANTSVAASMTSINESIQQALKGSSRWGDSIAVLVNGWAALFAKETQSGGGLAGSVKDLGSALDYLENRSTFGSLLTGIEDFIEGSASSTNQLKAQISQIDQSLAALAANGNAERAFATFQQMMQQTGRSAEQLAGYFPELNRQLHNTAETLGVASQLSAKDYAEWMGGKIPEAVQKAAAAAGQSTGLFNAQAASMTANANSAKAMREAMLEAANAQLGAFGAVTNYHQAVQTATQALRDNGATLDVNTAQGLANRNALAGIASSALQMVSTQYEAGVSTDELRGQMAAARAQFIAVATQMTKNAATAAAMADQFGLIPEAVTTTFTTPGAKGSANEVAALHQQIQRLPADKQVQIIAVLRDQGVAAAKKLIDSIQSKTVTVNTVYRVEGGVPKTYYPNGMQASGAANGAVFDSVTRTQLLRSFANGGEHHVAQIAPAGAWRLWAEPETGGEAYIPFAPSKRRRSLAIWAEVGRRLGVPGFASGGSMVSPGAPTVNVGSPNVNVQVSLDGRQLQHEMRLTVADELGRAQVARRRAAL